MTVAPEVARRTDGGATKVRQEGRCRMCQRPGYVRPVTRHHLVKREWFKGRLALIDPPLGREWHALRRLRDADANIVPLCEPCHRDVERDLGSRRLLRKVLAPIEVTFCIQVRGQRWFEHRYPPSRKAVTVP